MRTSLASTNISTHLVGSAIGDGAYRGHTVLTLEMAYTNARLVARPDSEWLTHCAAPIPAADEAFGAVASSDEALGDG